MTNKEPKCTCPCHKTNDKWYQEHMGDDHTHCKLTPPTQTTPDSLETKEFDKLMETCICGDDDRKEIKKFIHSAVTRARQEERAKIKKDLPSKYVAFHAECKEGKCEPCDTCLGKMAHNKIIDDILSTLKECA